MDGFLVVDKAPAMTSHDVVAVARKALGTRKVGHAGTLDPMATGVLVLGFGNGTRLLQYITDGDKSYLATVVLGAATVTDDQEGEVISEADASKITDEEIRSGLSKMVGEIQQRPSSVSAVKVAGERAYDRVRAGEVFELAARTITISSLEVLDIRRTGARIEIDIDVTCSAGTFIRAIARDLGSELAVGGHLSALRRTRVAGFAIDQAITFDALKAQDFKTLDLIDDYLLFNSIILRQKRFFWTTKYVDKDLSFGTSCHQYTKISRNPKVLENFYNLKLFVLQHLS